MADKSDDYKRGFRDGTRHVTGRVFSVLVYEAAMDFLRRDSKKPADAKTKHRAPKNFNGHWIGCLCKRCKGRRS